MAIRVSGAADYSRTTNLPNSAAFTAMGWFRVPTLSGWMSWIQLSGGGSFYQLGVEGSSGSNKFILGSNAAMGDGPALTNGTWYHAAVIVNGTTGTNAFGYLNGVVNSANPDALSFTASKLWIGNSTGGDPLNGNIAYVKIWDAVLTVAELLQEMQQGALIRTANINTFSPFLSLSDDEKDFSGNGFDWTVTGTPTVENGPPIPWRQGRGRIIYPAAGGGGTNVTLNPSGFGLSASLGAPTELLSGVQVSPTGFGVTASQGTPAISAGNTQTPSGFGLTASLGTPAVLRSGVQISPAGFGLTATLGTPSVSVGGPTLTPSGFGLVVSLGTFATQNDITITGVSGFALAAALGTPAILRGATITPSGFALAASLGTPSVLKSGVQVSPTGFALATSLGAPSITVGGPLILPSGFALSASLGAPTTRNDIALAVAGFALSVSLGAPITHNDIVRAVVGFALSAGLGVPTVAVLGPGGLALLDEPLHIDFDPLDTQIAFQVGDQEMFTIRFYRGEVVPIVLTLKGKDPDTGAFVAHDLTGAVSKTITVKKPSATSPIIAARDLSVVGSPASGRATFTPVPSEVAVGGRYEALAVVTYPGSPDPIVRKFPGRVIIEDAIA